MPSNKPTATDKPQVYPVPVLNLRKFKEPKHVAQQDKLTWFIKRELGL